MCQSSSLFYPLGPSADPRFVPACRGHASGSSHLVPRGNSWHVRGERPTQSQFRLLILRHQRPQLQPKIMDCELITAVPCLLTCLLRDRQNNTVLITCITYRPAGAAVRDPGQEGGCRVRPAVSALQPGQERQQLRQELSARARPVVLEVCKRQARPVRSRPTSSCCPVCSRGLHRRRRCRCCQ